MKTDCINACISIAHNTGKSVDCAMKQLGAIEQSLSESKARDAERIAIGTALGWLMEASEVNLGSGDDEFNEAWLNAESVMCDMPQGAFLSLDELEEIEWVDGRCPVCSGIDPSVTDNPMYRGHRTNGGPRCWLESKIKQAKGV